MPEDQCPHILTDEDSGPVQCPLVQDELLCYGYLEECGIRDCYERGFDDGTDWYEELYGELS